MGSFSIWHWLIVMVIVLLLFGGAGKIPKLMGDMAKGVKAFKHGLKEDDEPAAQPQQARASIEGEAKPAEQHDTAAKH
jgi:sec-independent protein translocase protein TatA